MSEETYYCEHCGFNVPLSNDPHFCDSAAGIERLQRKVELLEKKVKVYEKIRNKSLSHSEKGFVI